MCAAMVDRNTEYPDYGRPVYDSQPQNDYGRASYDYNRPSYDSYQQPGDYNRSSYEAPRGQDYPPYQNSSDPPVKEDQANRRREEIMHQQQALPPQPTNQTEMYDHNQMSQQLREERRKEYNDYLDNHKQSDVKSVKSDRSLSTPSKRVTSPPHQANIGHDDYGAFRRQTELEVRRKDYNEFLAKKQQLEDDKRQKLAEQRRQAPAPIIKGDYYDSEQYDRRRQALNDLQHKEYQNYLKNHEQHRNRVPTPDNLQGLPLSQRQYDSMRKMQEKQRNQEYNQLLAKKGFNQHQPPETNRRPELGMKSEFQDQKQDTDRYKRQENVQSNNRIGFMSQLGRPVEEMREKLAKERHEEYNKYLQDKYVSQSQHRPLERPKWVDPKLMEDNWQKEAAGSGSRSRPNSDKPVQTPTYEEMLERKRREEASYRRFDDPEYSRSGADRGYDSQYRRYNDQQ